MFFYRLGGPRQRAPSASVAFFFAQPLLCHLRRSAGRFLRNSVTSKVNASIVSTTSNPISRYIDDDAESTADSRIHAFVSDIVNSTAHFVDVVVYIANLDPLKETITSSSMDDYHFAGRMGFYCLVVCVALLRPPGTRGKSLRSRQPAAAPSVATGAAADVGAAVAGGGGSGADAGADADAGARKVIMLGRAAGALVPHVGTASPIASVIHAAGSLPRVAAAFGLPTPAGGEEASGDDWPAPVPGATSPPLTQGEFIKGIAEVRMC